MQHPPSSGRSLWSSQSLPEASEVAAGIWKFTLPIPFPLRTVNLYALKGKQGWTLVDAGMGLPEAREALQQGLARAGLQVEQLQSLVLTHLHPDHVGMSGELQKLSDAQVLMHPIDEQGIHVLWGEAMPEVFAAMADFLRQHGLADARTWQEQVDPQMMRSILRVPPHSAFLLVEDGATLELADELYRVIWVPGHSDGMISLLRERDGVYISADHVLPRITPNVGLYSADNRPDPLGDYLTSLRKIESLPVSLVLPGHGEPWPDLAGRVREIIQHHQEREAEILSLLQEGSLHAAAITGRLFPSQRIQRSEALRMAVGEVVAHLEHMRLQGRVQAHHSDEGIVLYTIVS